MRPKYWDRFRHGADRGNRLREWIRRIAGIGRRKRSARGVGQRRRWQGKSGRARAWRNLPISQTQMVIKGSCAGGVRAAIAVEAIQKPVAAFYQSKGAVALI